MYNQSEEKNFHKKAVVFVCTGNSCRSVMAEGLFRRIINTRKGIDIASAGIRAIPGMLPSTYALEFLKKYGVDMSEHLARPFDYDLAKKADYIIVMTHEHRSEIVARYMDIDKIQEKTQLLMHFASDPDLHDQNVPDPIGLPYDQYEKCARQMWDPLVNLAGSI